MRSEQYREAFKTLCISGQRLNDETYAVGHYLLGLAAECALRSLVADDPSIPLHPHRLGELFNEVVKKNPNLSDLASKIRVLQIMWNNLDRYRNRNEFIRRIPMPLLKQLKLTTKDLKSNPPKVLARIRECILGYVLALGKAVNIYV